MTKQQGSPSGDRPSFATFWKNSQNELTAKELIFVQSAPGQPSNKAVEKNGDSEQTAKNKRRAQVRKAQVQHRQRKANYVKQLEANITGIRDKTADAERERQILRSENEAIRAQLSASATYDQAVVPGFDVTAVPPYVPGLDGEGPIHGFGINPNFDMSFSMSQGVDAYMSTAAIFDSLEVSPRATSGAGSSVYGSPQFMDSSDTSSPYPNVAEMAADQQSQQAMNLFLARVGEFETRFGGIQPQYAPMDDGINGLLTGPDNAQNNRWRGASEHFER